MIPFLSFVLPLAFYLRWPSCFWNVDGVACAAALELGNPVYLFHSNHLLYGFLGFLFWKGIAAPLGLSRALPALQLFTSLLSCVGLIALYKILEKIFPGERWLALTLSVAFALTAVFWVWSVEAQVYALGFAALAFATERLLRDESPAKYRKVGLLHALAVLGHVMNLLWIIPAGWWIYSQDNIAARRKNFWIYSLWMGTTVVIAYALVYLIVLRPAHLGPSELANWFKGSAGLTPDRHWAWHTTGWSAPLQWVHSTLCFFWGSLWPYAGTRIALWLWIVTDLSMAIVSLLVGLCFVSKPSPLRTFSLLWLAVYGLFLWTWEPSTLCYRMSDCIPLALLLGLGLKQVGDIKIKWVLASGLFASFLIISWTSRIRPMSQTPLNSLWVQTVNLSKITSDRSLYLLEGGEPWIYLLYFTGRSGWDVSQRSPQEMAAFFAHRGDRPVYIRSELLRKENQMPWIHAHHWKSMDDLPWLEMQS